MYGWRKLSAEQREEVLKARKQMKRPWHGPPHFGQAGTFMLTGTCYEHQPVLGLDVRRLTDFSVELLGCAESLGAVVRAWCVLPNHYHLLLSVKDLKSMVRALGRLHGRKSYEWNLADDKKRRKVWHAVGAAFLGIGELCASQSGEAWVGGEVGRVDVEQCWRIFKRSGTGGSAADLARVSGGEVRGGVG